MDRPMKVMLMASGAGLALYFAVAEWFLGYNSSHFVVGLLWLGLAADYVRYARRAYNNEGIFTGQPNDSTTVAEGRIETREDVDKLILTLTELRQLLPDETPNRPDKEVIASGS